MVLHAVEDEWIHYEDAFIRGEELLLRHDLSLWLSIDLRVAAIERLISGEWLEIDRVDQLFSFCLGSADLDLFEDVGQVRQIARFLQKVSEGVTNGEAEAWQLFLALFVLRLGNEMPLGALLVDMRQTGWLLSVGDD